MVARCRCSSGPGRGSFPRNGDLWRWDGYSLQAGTASAAGARLIERSRLAALETEVRRGARPRPPRPTPSLPPPLRKAEAAGLKTKALRQEAKEAHAELDRTRDQIAAAEHEAQATSKELGALAEALTRTRAGLDEARHIEAEWRRRCSRSLPPPRWKPHSKRHKPRPPRAARRRHAPRPRSKVSSARCGSARSACEAIGAEQALWQKRIANAREQIATLRAREEETSADLAALANLPAEIEQRRCKLFDAIAAAERERGKAADDLAVAETASETVARRPCARCRSGLAEAREARARSEARLEGGARAPRRDARTRSAISSTARRKPACRSPG